MSETASDDSDALVEGLRPRWLRRGPGERYELTRFVFLRLLGALYVVAFLCVARQFLPLCGEHGLLPAKPFLDDVQMVLGTSTSRLRLPTLFWVDASDAAFRLGAGVGVALSLLVLAGFANAPILALLWALYLSFVQVGQLFYGYGWETLLLETGFLAIFLAAPLDPRPFAARTRAPVIVIVLLRWLLFRLMLGAGLIKLRGDPCWRDLTCLVYHYETQPLPNPASWLFHQLPRSVHVFGVLVNHAAELVAPFFLFGPRRFRLVGAFTIVAFQLLLVVSGNLSWLNWLTIGIAVGSLDDRCLARVPGLARVCDALSANADEPIGRTRRGVLLALATLVGVLSINPVSNMLSPNQMMNSGFDPLNLVNTYGAFGTVGRERYELVIQGTLDDPESENARYFDYELPCKPGDVNRAPCVVAPYQERLDWQLWFAAMSDYEHDPWVAHLAYELLCNDHDVLSLFAKNPFFPRAPRAIRVQRFRYEFTRFGDHTNAWWRRTEPDSYLRAVTKEDPELLGFLRAHGWQTEDGP